MLLPGQATAETSDLSYVVGERQSFATNNLWAKRVTLAEGLPVGRSGNRLRGCDLQIH